MHRSKLVEIERGTAEPGAALAVQHRPAAVDQDRERPEGEERRGEHEAEHGERHVDSPREPASRPPTSRAAAARRADAHRAFSQTVGTSPRRQSYSAKTPAAHTPT